MCIAGGRIDDFAAGIAAGTERNENASHVHRQVAAHQHLFFEGDARTHIFIVEQGWVKLYRTLIDGQRQIVGFGNPGTVLGLESELEHVNGCEAVTAVTVRAIPIGRVTEMCRRDPAVADMLMRQIGRQLGAAQAQIAAIGTQSAEQKLATFLLSISDLCGADDCAEFDLPMRRGDMAEFLGLRLETVSRKMTELQRRGLIRMTSLYHCRIQRRDILQDLSEGGEATQDGMLRAV